MKVLTLMMVGLIVMEALATAVDQCSDSNIVRTQERPHNLTMTRVDQALEDETPFTVIHLSSTKYRPWLIDRKWTIRPKTCMPSDESNYKNEVSVCRWYYKKDKNPSRFPAVLWEAILAPGQSSCMKNMEDIFVNFSCVAIYDYVEIMRKTECKKGTKTIITWKKDVEKICRGYTVGYINPLKTTA